MVDATSVIGTHLTEVVRRHAHELFTRQDAKVFCDRVAQENPKVIEDLVPNLLPLATIQRVIQNMLRERVPIRDGVGILEALGEAAHSSKNPVLLTEYVRQAVRRAIVKQVVNPQGEIPAYLMDPSIERAIEASVEHGEMNSVLTMAPERDSGHSWPPGAPNFEGRIGGGRYQLRVPIFLASNCRVVHAGLNRAFA